jgi:ACS family glucarate transporter-like MFS transporter
MLFMASALNYADRSSLSVVKKQLHDEFKIDVKLFAQILMVWGIAYVIGQIPSGRLLDRYGTKRVYGIALLLWSTLELCFGFTKFLPGGNSVTWALFILTFLLGLMEAPAFPGNARIVAQWFPAKERGTATATFNSAQYFSLVAFGPLMGIVAYYLGWPWVFWVMGGIGIVLTWVWFRVVHSPLEHPRVNAEELNYIREGGALVDVTHGKTGAKRGWFYAWQLLWNRKLLAVYLAQFCITTLTFFYVQWIIPYLLDRGFNILQSGFIAALPNLFGFAGGLLGGVISDGLLRAGFSITAARKTPIIAGMFAASTVVLCNYIDSAWLVVAVLCFAFFGKGMGAMGWTVVAETAPKQVLGLAGGIFNTFGNSAQIALALFVGNFAVSSPSATSSAPATGIATGVSTSVTTAAAQNSSFHFVILYVGASAIVAALSYIFLVGKIERIVLREPEENAKRET